MNSLWALAAIGVFVGVLSMWVFRRIADRQAIRQAVNRIQAHLLEFWLFADDPSLIWKSWRGLLAANARLLRLLAVPMLVLSPPTVLLYFCLDSNYGHSPLQIGRAALVTVQLTRNLDPLSQPPILTAPVGIAIETPPVSVSSERQLSWRIRPAHAVFGWVRCMIAGGYLEKSVAAGPDFRFLSQRRVRRVFDWLRYPTESPLHAGLVDWIEVSYPPRTIPFLSMDAHWSVWFTVSFLMGAMLPGGVTALKKESLP